MSTGDRPPRDLSLSNLVVQNKLTTSSISTLSLSANTVSTNSLSTDDLIINGTNFTDYPFVFESAPATLNYVPRFKSHHFISDSTLSIDDNGSSILHTISDVPLTSYPWFYNNLTLSNIQADESLAFYDPENKVYAPILTNLPGKSGKKHSPMQNSNVALGYTAMNALVALPPGLRRTPHIVRNVAVGATALFKIGNGDLSANANENVAVGTEALYELISGNGNTAVGWATGPHTVVGNFNVFVGHDCGTEFDINNTVLVGAGSRDYSAGGNTVVVGANAHNQHNEIGYDVIIGNNAVSDSIGGHQVIIGSGSSDTSVNGNNVIIGSNAINTFDNVIVLGSNTSATSSNQLVLGSGLSVTNHLPFLNVTYLNVKIAGDATAYYLPLHF